MSDFTKERLLSLMHSIDNPALIWFPNNCEILKAVEYLIKNDVIVLPCKVGDVVYEADGEHGVVTHNITEVHWVFNTRATDDAGNKWTEYYCDEDILEAYFTREEVEKALKKRDNQNGE